jgi:hypothetical protein
MRPRMWSCVQCVLMKISLYLKRGILNASVLILTRKHMHLNTREAFPFKCWSSFFETCKGYILLQKNIVAFDEI